MIHDAGDTGLYSLLSTLLSLSLWILALAFPFFVVALPPPLPLFFRNHPFYKDALSSLLPPLRKL